MVLEKWPRPRAQNLLQTEDSSKPAREWWRQQVIRLSTFEVCNCSHFLLTSYINNNSFVETAQNQNNRYWNRPEKLTMKRAFDFSRNDTLPGTSGKTP